MFSPVPSAPLAWPQDFTDFLTLLTDISTADYACLHAGSWLLVEPDGARIPISIIATTPQGQRLGLSIVGADSLEAAMLRLVAPARPLITFEELREAWNWYTCRANDNDRLNCVLAKFDWIEIAPDAALWATTAALC
jgi:hypothetical protein